MRRSKEIIVLFALLVGAMVFVLWYVIDRRAKNRAAPTRPMVTAPAPGPLPPQDIALDATTERKTIDFSSGQPVVKDTAEDKAAIDAALKDMKEATESVTFEAPKKTAAPPVPAKP